MAHTLSRNSTGGMKARISPNDRGPSVMVRTLAAGLTLVRGAWVRHRDGCRLQELSDYQLRDIGIQRGQIDDVVRNGHY